MSVKRLRQRIRFLKYKIIGFAKKWRIEYPIRFIGKVSLGSNISIGKYSYIVSGTIGPGTQIGRYCSIAQNVYIGTLNHPITWLSTSTFQYSGAFADTVGHSIKDDVNTKAVVIGNDVWIGVNVIIKNGVKIDDGSIIGAGAIVTKDVPPYAIVGGNPARIIKYRFKDEIIKELLEIKWWEYDEKILWQLPFNNIQKCIEILKQKGK